MGLVCIVTLSLGKLVFNVFLSYLMGSVWHRDNLVWDVKDGCFAFRCLITYELSVVVCFYF